MPIEKHGKIMFTATDLEPIAKGNGIVNGTLGGLILGNYHSEGGIMVIRQYQKEDLYEAIAEFEGWEYLLNPLATSKAMEYLIKLNSEFESMNDVFTEYLIPEEIQIIDTRPILKGIKKTNKIILLDEWSQFIVNKHSTKKYLSILNNLNKKYSR